MMRSIAAAAAMIAFLWPRRGLRLKYRALRLEFFTFGAAAKGSERSLQPRVERRDRGFDLFDRLQMLTDQEAMMVAQASFQRGGEFLARAGELGMAEFGQPPRVALARHDRLQDAPAAPAQDVGNDRGQLDVGLLQRRLNPLGV